jgi:arsenical pump membrane protein
MVALIGAGAILLLTIALIVTQPRGLSESWTAVGGAVAMLLLRFATLSDLWAVVREVYGVLLFLLGMMALTAAVERSGFFDLLALWTARGARGSGRLLFVGIFLLGAAITVLLSLDVTVLVLTPIVYALMSRLRLNALPYMFVCTFVANTGSLLLPISNLTNLLAYGLLGLSFGGFARTMVLPQVVALAATLAMLFLLFHKQIPRRFDRAALPAMPEVDDGLYLRIAAVVLALVLLALAAAGLNGWPIYPPALAGAAALLFVAFARRRVKPHAIAGEISWGLFPFVIGMFTVIRGTEELWLRQLGGLTLTAHDLGALLALAFGTALGANLVNNVPMIAGLIGILDHAAPGARAPLALAAILGANLGPVVTPFGSLATLLWLTIVRRKGEDLTTLEYMRVGALIAPPVLLLATLALWAVLR